MNRDLKVNNNLFYHTASPIYFGRDLGGSYEEANPSTWIDSDITFSDNVALGIGSEDAFYGYNNNRGDSATFRDTGEIFNNVIDGNAVEQGWAPPSALGNNLPEVYDYNLWYSQGQQRAVRDRADGALTLTLPGDYFMHSVIENNAVTYDSATMTVTVPDDYAGRGAGRDGHTIGGFTFGGTSSGSAYDINDDNSVNIADVVLCVNIILGIEDGDGDVNQDGETTIMDVTAIVNEILGN